jgi:hypothetical protein
MSDVLDPNPELEPADGAEASDNRFEPVTTIFLAAIGLLLLICLLLLLIGEQRPPPGL